MNGAEILADELITATCALEAAYGTRSPDLMEMAKARWEAARTAVINALNKDQP